jgi:hypothetical protein
MLSAGRNTLDYGAFLEIGHRFLDGHPIWTGNSYYLMPMVLIFAVFAWLPPVPAFILWHLTPVLFALWLANGSPWVLLFAPLFAHTLSGQSAFFGLVGLWIYYRYRTKPLGGLGLALMLLKPQLGIVSFLWVVRHWKWKQIIVAGAVTLAMYLPGFLLIPDWLFQWLRNARGISERALAGIVPRLLVILFGEPPHLKFWILLTVCGLALLLIMRSRPITFRRWEFAGFLLSPFTSDYDLIQLIAILDKRTLPIAAIASIPTWIVIFTAYENDHAWIAVTLIPITLFLNAYWKSLPFSTKYRPARNSDP